MKHIIATAWNALRTRRSLFIIGTTIILAASAGSYYWFVSKPCESILTRPPEEIKGKIITLRTLKKDYFIDYHNAFSTMVRQNLEFPEFITLDYTLKYLQDQLDKAQKGKILLYCIFDNKDNKLIGEIEIREKNDEDPGQFGWWINEAYWGGGRAQEALKLIANIYFRLKPHEKGFIAHVRLWNKRGYHAIKKAGFVDVGYFYEGGQASRYIVEYRKK
ncbi:MAG: GNAT family N-acetyltransferase [Candidatus Babeliales bacterium]